jgi:hypothetical protein
MRALKAVVMLAVAALLAFPAQAADYPEYPPIDYPPLPPVDYGLGGSFYLRGSVAANAWWASDGTYCACVATFNSPGYGYSLGGGFGYETGDGIRADITIDYLSNGNLTSSTGHTVNLRSGLLLANVYYDFPLSGLGHSAEGGFGLYVGAGLGAAKNHSEVMNGGTQVAWGHSLEAAGAVMAGVSYDMGNMVADLGYRGIYMNKVMSQPPNPANAYIINNNFIHELRGTLRYRF